MRKILKIHVFYLNISNCSLKLHKFPGLLPNILKVNSFKTVIKISYFK